MQQKIRYRLVYNYAGRLNREGLAPVSIECRQGAQKIYMSSHVLILPSQWKNGMVINHENAGKLTTYLIHWRNSIEDIELDALLKGKKMTLHQLKTAVKSGLRPNVPLREFMTSVIDNDSSRRTSTKRSYHYLVNELEREYGTLTITDITYDLIIRFRESQRKKGLSENTIKGRLKALNCLCHEAIKRDIITDSPFKNVVIGNIGGRKGGLTISELRRIDRLQLDGIEDKVRDLFVLSCTCGLRWGDLSTLEEAEIKDGILRKVMHKTNHEVFLPIGTLFNGRPLEIISKYEDITALSHCCCNTTANRTLKDIARKAHISKRIFFHAARKTFGQILNSFGMDMTDISILMGHVDSRTTRTHYVFNDAERIKRTVRKIFK